jgi:hypothetical protein
MTDEDLEAWVLIKSVLATWLQLRSHDGSTEPDIDDVRQAEMVVFARSGGALSAYIKEDLDRRLGVVLGNLMRLAGSGVQMQAMTHNARVRADEWLTDFQMLDEIVNAILNNPDALPPTDT